MCMYGGDASVGCRDVVAYVYELSVEPSSTMIISDSSGSCGRMLSTHRRRYVPVL